MQTINIEEKFGRFTDHWSPKVVGTVNDFHVKLAKVQGEFEWHHHDDEDELFLVVRGTLRMKFRDREATIQPGEFIIVPHGVEHMPVADEETWVMLFEPKTTLNTGTVTTERTVADLEHI